MERSEQEILASNSEEYRFKSTDWVEEYPFMIDQGFVMETGDDGETWWVL